MSFSFSFSALRPSFRFLFFRRQRKKNWLGLSQTFSTLFTLVLWEQKVNNSKDFQLTYQAPFSVVSCFCFPDGRTPCVKIMTTYSAVGARWVKNLHYTWFAIKKYQSILNMKIMLFKSSTKNYSNFMKICFLLTSTVLKTCIGSSIL